MSTLPSHEAGFRTKPRMRFFVIISIEIVRLKIMLIGCRLVLGRLTQNHETWVRIPPPELYKVLDIRTRRCLIVISSDFDQYIGKYIDSYLFDDLETLHGIKQSRGNGAYLFIFAVCSGMEFLGLLAREGSPVVNERIDASHALAHYIKHYLIPSVADQHKSSYSNFLRIAPALVRNGLAHSYAIKGPIAVGRHNHVYKHMEFQSINGANQFFINADTLYLDFKNSYDTKFRLLIQSDGVLYERALAHYEEIRSIYKREVEATLN